MELKPAVVHAWLDWSNVRAGIAAVLAGVPRIILSGRNLNPSNFFFDAPRCGLRIKLYHSNLIKSRLSTIVKQELRIMPIGWAFRMNAWALYAMELTSVIFHVRRLRWCGSSGRRSEFQPVRRSSVGCFG